MTVFGACVLLFAAMCMYWISRSRKPFWTALLIVGLTCTAALIIAYWHFRTPTPAELFRNYLRTDIGEQCQVVKVFRRGGGLDPIYGIVLAAPRSEVERIVSTAGLRPDFPSRRLAEERQLFGGPVPIEWTSGSTEEGPDETWSRRGRESPLVFLRYDPEQQRAYIQIVFH
jgi:hypothetical protein